jgi:hypothetical protein
MFEWPVSPTTNDHVCFKAAIGDRQPAQNTGGIPASDDTNSVNNHAQQNVFDIVARGSSPIEPIDFTFTIDNGGPLAELVRLRPRDLPSGVQLRIRPAVREVPAGGSAHFRVRAVLDDSLLDAQCGRDMSFLLEAWRRDDHSEERWSACKYVLRPRRKTEIEIDGYFYGSNIQVWGDVTPESVGAAHLQIMVHISDQEPMWIPTILGAGAHFEIEVPTAGATGIAAVVAYYNGSPEYAPATSNLLELEHTFTP